MTLYFDWALFSSEQNKLYYPMSPVNHETFSEQFEQLQILKRTLEQNPTIPVSQEQLETLKIIEKNWVSDRFRELLIALGYTSILQQNSFLSDQKKQAQLTELSNQCAEKVNSKQYQAISKEIGTWLLSEKEKTQTHANEWIRFIDEVITTRTHFKKNTAQLHQWINQPEKRSDSSYKINDILKDVSKGWSDTAKQLTAFDYDQYIVRPGTPTNTHQSKLSLASAHEFSGFGDMKSPPGAPKRPRFPRLSNGSPRSNTTRGRASWGILPDSPEEELQTKIDQLKEEIKELKFQDDKKEEALQKLRYDLKDAYSDLERNEAQLAELEAYKQEIEQLNKTLNKLKTEQRKSEVGFNKGDNTNRERINELETEIYDKKGKIHELNHKITTLEDNLNHARDAGHEVTLKLFDLQKAVRINLEQLTGHQLNTGDETELNEVINELHKHQQGMTNKVNILEEQHQTALDNITELKEREKKLIQIHKEEIEELRTVTANGLEAEGYDTKIVEISEQKQHLEKQLSELNEQLESKQNAYNQLQVERDQLQNQYNDQQSEIQLLQSEIAANTAILTQNTNTETDTDKVAELKIEIEALQEERNQLQDALNETGQELNNYIVQFKAIAEDLETKEQEKEDKQRQYEQLQLEYDDIAQQLTAARQTITEGKQEAQTQLEKVRSEYQSSTQQLEEEITILKRTANSNQSKSPSKHFDVQRLYARAEALHKQSEQSQRVLAEFAKKLATEKLDIEKTHTQALETQTKTFQETINAISRECEEHKHNAADLAEREMQYEMEILNLTGTLKNTKNELIAFENEKQATDQSIQALQSEIADLKSKTSHVSTHEHNQEALKEAQQEIERLQVELQTEQDRAKELEVEYQKTRDTYEQQYNDHHAQTEKQNDFEKYLQETLSRLSNLLEESANNYKTQISHWRDTTDQLGSKFKDLANRDQTSEQPYKLLAHYREQLAELMKHNDDLAEQLENNSPSEADNSHKTDASAEKIQSLETQLSEIRTQYNHLKRDLETKNHTIADLKQRLESEIDPLTRTNTDTDNSSIFSQHARSSHPTTPASEYGSNLNQLLETEGKIKQLEHRIQKLQGENERLKNKSGFKAGLERDIEIDEKNLKIRQLETEAEDLNDKIETANNELFKLQLKVSTKESETERYEQTNRELEKQVEELQTTIDKLNVDIEEIHEDFLEAVDNKVTEATQTYETQLKQARKEYEQLEHDFAQQREEYEQLEKQLELATERGTQRAPSSASEFIPDIHARDDQLRKLTEAVQNVVNAKETSALSDLQNQLNDLTSRFNQLNQHAQTQPPAQKTAELNPEFFNPILTELTAIRTGLSGVQETIQHQTARAERLEETRTLKETIQSLQGRIQELEKAVVNRPLTPPVYPSVMPEAQQAVNDTIDWTRPYPGPNRSHPDTPPPTRSTNAPTPKTIGGQTHQSLFTATLNPSSRPNRNIQAADKSNTHEVLPIAIPAPQPTDNPFEHLQHMAEWIKKNTNQLTYAVATHGYKLLEKRFHDLLKQQKHSKNKRKYDSTACREFLHQELSPYLFIKEKSANTTPIIAISGQAKLYGAYDLFKSAHAEPLALTPHSQLSCETNKSGDLKVELCSTAAKDPEAVQQALLNFAQTIIAHAEVYPGLTLTIDQPTDYTQECIDYLYAYKALYASVLKIQLNFNVETKTGYQPSDEDIDQKKNIILGVSECALFTDNIMNGLNPKVKQPTAKGSLSPSPLF